MAMTAARTPAYKPPEGARGLLIAVGLVLLLLAGSVLIAWALSSLTANAFPKAPPYLILIYGVLILVPAMLLLARAVPWMVTWYYLVPAIAVLAAFTLFPIALTVNFAFTNYSGQNSGNPDTSYKTPITLSRDRRTVTFTQMPGDLKGLSELFRCAQPTCAGETVVLYDQAGDVPVQKTIQSVTGTGVTLASPVSAAFAPTDATRLNSIGYVGLRNFQEIFGRATVELLPVLTWTLVFAFSTIILNALAGLILGILLYNKRLKFRNVYRTLLFLPWAIPAVISIQMWGALFNQGFGIVNKTLGLLGASPVPWLADPLWAKIAILLVNLWLGFPYMMTATISALSTIPDDLYEAADIDGAGRLQQIQFITLPMLRNAFTPIMLSGFAFNFNNFGIIYLLTLQAPGGSGGPPVPGQPSTAGATDILLSWGFNTAFASSGGSNYSLASAIAVIVFFLTVAISVVNFGAAGVFKEARV